MTTVFTMGSFDGMHPGHVGLLEQCRKLASKGPGRVLVAVNTDEFIRKFKHTQPIYTLEERLTMIRACRYVDGAVANDGTNQPDLIEAALPTGGNLVIGDDWEDRDYLAQIGLADDRGFLRRNKIELLYLPRTGDWSTTELKTRLRG